MSEGINPLEHAHYKSEELEKARQLLDDAKGKLDEAAKIFCSIMHDKDECYEECPALNKEGWVICYIYDRDVNAAKNILRKALEDKSKVA